MSHASTAVTLAVAFSLLFGGATPVSGLGVAPAGHERPPAMASVADRADTAATDPVDAVTAGRIDSAATDHVDAVKTDHVDTVTADSPDADTPRRLGTTVREQADDASGSFPEGNVSVTRGDEVTIVVSHSSPANVTIGGPEYGFHLTVRLGGSGTDEIVLDTRRTTEADPSAFVDGGSATLHTPPLDEPIEPEDYLLRVDVEGVERDIATLTVEPRGEMAAESYRAPGSFDPAEYVGGGEGDDANVGPLQSTMTDGSTVARGDYAVMRIEESGLETALNTSDLTGSAAANGLEVNFTQTDPGPNHEPREYVATDSANVTVLPSLANDEFYVLWNTSGMPIESQSERNRYRATLTLTEESSLSDGTETAATTAFDLRRQSVSLSPANDSVHYPWEADTFRVEGSTNRAPNTELEVRLRSSDPNAFLELADATVREDGRFEASFDLSSLTRGTNATLWIRDHFLETTQEVRLVAPDPTVRIENQTVEGTTVEVASAEVPAGGFVRLRDANGESVGRSDYLDPGQHANVSVELGTVLFEDQRLGAELVRPGEDESYDPDASAYSTDGYVINDTAYVSFPPTPTETSTPTQTATATATPSATPYPVVTRTPLNPAGATKSSLPLSPGVAVAAVLSAAAFLARRGESS